MSTENKEDLAQRAILAEQAGRYDDMTLLVKRMTELGEELSTEERNLLSIAYRNAVGARRSSWRTVSLIEHKVKTKIAKEYREKIAAELMGKCMELFGLLDEYLIPKADSPVSKVFFVKMKGDYYRYLAEVAIPSERSAVIENAERFYQEAFDLAKDKMPPTHPIRLGLALNFSVFFSEIANATARAYEFAKKAVDDASDELGTLSEEAHNECTAVLHLLRENLTLWTPVQTGDDLMEEGEPERGKENVNN